MGNSKIENNFNILFITQNDPFYIRIFFEYLFRQYKKLNEIKGMVVCSTMGKKNLRQLIKQMYSFYGLRDFVRMGLRFVLYKMLSKVSGFLKIRRFYSLEQVCKFYNIEIVKTNNINDHSFLDEIKKKDIDVIISVASPKIFREDLLNLPKWGCINIHHGKLPKYRGMMPNFWQLHNNESKVGITIHKMNPKIDAGEIILQSEEEVIIGEPLDSLIKRTKRAGAELMIQAIDKIRNNEIEYIENKQSQGSYYSFPTKRDVIKFKKMGNRIL